MHATVIFFLVGGDRQQYGVGNAAIDDCYQLLVFVLSEHLYWLNDLHGYVEYKL